MSSPLDRLKAALPPYFEERTTLSPDGALHIRVAQASAPAFQRLAASFGYGATCIEEREQTRTYSVIATDSPARLEPLRLPHGGSLSWEEFTHDPFLLDTPLRDLEIIWNHLHDAATAADYASFKTALAKGDPWIEEYPSPSHAASLARGAFASYFAKEITLSELAHCQAISAVLAEREGLASARIEVLDPTAITDLRSPLGKHGISLRAPLPTMSSIHRTVIFYTFTKPQYSLERLVESSTELTTGFGQTLTKRYCLPSLELMRLFWHQNYPVSPGTTRPVLRPMLGIRHCLDVLLMNRPISYGSALISPLRGAHKCTVPWSISTTFHDFFPHGTTEIAMGSHVQLWIDLTKKLQKEGCPLHILTLCADRDFDRYRHDYPFPERAFIGSLLSIMQSAYLSDEEADRLSTQVVLFLRERFGARSDDFFREVMPYRIRLPIPVYADRLHKVIYGESLGSPIAETSAPSSPLPRLLTEELPAETSAPPPPREPEGALGCSCGLM